MVHKNKQSGEGSVKNAELAFEKYRAAKETGNAELARLYILNALTHDPKLKYLKAYVDDIKNAEADRESLIEQASNLLSVAALNGSCEDIEEIQGLIRELQELDDSEASELDADDLDALEEIKAKLGKYSWQALKKSKGLADLRVLGEKIDVCKQALESGLLSDYEAERVLLEMTQAQTMQNVETSMTEVIRLVTIVKEGPGSRGSQPKDLAALSQASGILSQLWTIADIGYCQREDYERRLRDVQAEYIQAEDKVKKSISAAVVEKMSSVVQALDGRDFNKCTNEIHAVQNAIKTVQDLMAQITYDESKVYAQNIVKKLVGRLEDVMRARYAAYQKHVAELCVEALKGYEDENFVINGEDKAESLLKKYRIAEIDETQLSPEASSIYHAARDTIAAKFSAKHKADFDYRCVVSGKISIEEF